jgi:glyoxylase-like metal-dependent hydrolase (beta-lactamase superfamily II)
MGEEQQALLIDTGAGTRAGRRLWRILEEHNLRLVAIFNTHCHGDHVGGNAYLVERSGARVYAPAYDAVVMQYPSWGTLCMFGGAEPLAEFRIPRFAPQPCTADVIVTEGELQIAGVTVRAVPLPGHTGSHTGYIVNGTFFTGDTLAGEAELENTPFSYAYSITRHLQSLVRLRDLTCAYYVLGHGGVEREIGVLIDRNIAQILDVLDFIRTRLARGCAEASELLTVLCAHYGIEIRNVRQYYYWYPILHSYLSHLSSGGQIHHKIEGNRLLWCAA